MWDGEEKKNWRGEWGGSPSLSLLFSFLPTSPPKKAYSIPSLLYIQQRLVTGTITHKWGLRVSSSQSRAFRAGAPGMCPWHPTLEPCSPLCKWCPCVMNAVELDLCSEMSGREWMGLSSTSRCPGAPLQEETRATGDGDLCSFNSSHSRVWWGACPQGSSHKKATHPHPFERQYTISEGEADHRFNIFLMTWSYLCDSPLDCILLQGRAGISIF